MCKSFRYLWARKNYKLNKKLEVVVKNHYFSRIHILDATRLISKIILQNHDMKLESSRRFSQ